MTVNTIDLGNKKRDEDTELMTFGPRMRKKYQMSIWRMSRRKAAIWFFRACYVGHLTYLSLIMPLVPLCAGNVLELLWSRSDLQTALWGQPQTGNYQ